MEIITMESSAYKELLDKIEKIAGYVRESERERTRKKDAADVWLDNREVMALLCISRRTLQRLRESGRIGYAIFRGTCRYPFSELERLIKESTFNCNPQTLEEFKQNYLLRTGGKTTGNPLPTDRENTPTHKNNVRTPSARTSNARTSNAKYLNARIPNGVSPQGNDASEQGRHASFHVPPSKK